MKCKSRRVRREPDQAHEQLPASTPEQPRRSSNGRRSRGQHQRAQQPGAEPSPEELRQCEAAAQEAAEALLREEEQAAAQQQAVASAKAARNRAKRERQRQQRQVGPQAAAEPAAVPVSASQPAGREAPGAPRSPATQPSPTPPSTPAAIQLAAAPQQQSRSKPASPAVEDSAQEVAEVHLSPTASISTTARSSADGMWDLSALQAQLGVSQPDAGDNVQRAPLLQPAHSQAGAAEGTAGVVPSTIQQADSAVAAAQPERAGHPTAQASTAPTGVSASQQPPLLHRALSGGEYVACEEAARAAVCVPCGHCALCMPCAQCWLAGAGGGPRPCPICRAEVRGCGLQGQAANRLC